MSQAFVRHAHGATPSGTSTTATATFPSQAAGNFNLITVQFGGAANILQPNLFSVTVTDSVGNTYYPASPVIEMAQNAAVGTGGSVVLYQRLFYAKNIGGSAGANTVTATFGSAMSFYYMTATEYSGVAGIDNITNRTHIEGETAVTQTNFTVGGYTSTPGQIVVGVFTSGDGGQTPEATFTSRSNSYTVALGDKLVASAGPTSYTGVCTGQSGWLLSLISLSSVPVTGVGTGLGEVLLNSFYSGSGGATQELARPEAYWSLWSPGSGSRYAQIDAGVACSLSRARWTVNCGQEDLPIGSTLLGSNDPTFATGVQTVYTFAGRSLSNVLTNQVTSSSFSQSTPYRYYRLVTTAGSGFVGFDLYATWVSGIIARPADVSMTPTTGAFDKAISVTLSCLTTSATIYYTTDGTCPTSASSQYSGPVTVSSSGIFSAIAISPGCLATSRLRQLPVHIGLTEVSTDVLYDNRGNRIWAMNGDYFHDPISGYWYWFGSNHDSPNIYNWGYGGNNIYRSPDLRNWEYRGVIHQGTTQDGGTTNKTAEILPRLLYSASTSKYVCWTDSYQVVTGSFTWNGKRAWTASNIEGPYTLANNYTVIGTALNLAGDYDVIDDGTHAYLWANGSQPGDGGNTSVYRIQLNADAASFSASYVASDYGTIYGGTAHSMTMESTHVFYDGTHYFLLNTPLNQFSAARTYYAYASTALGAFTNSGINPFQSSAAVDNLHSYGTQPWKILKILGRTGGFEWFGDFYGIGNEQLFTHFRRFRLPVSVSGTNLSISWNNAWSFDGSFPSVAAPAAPSGLVVYTNGTAHWTNNEPTATKLYVDTASDSAFTLNVASVPVPDGSSTASNLPSAGYYRVRAVNASGSSLSNSTTASTGVSKKSLHVPWFLRHRALKGV